MIDSKQGSKRLVVLRLFAGLVIVLAALSSPQVAHATGPRCYVDDSAGGTGTGASWANAFTNLQLALTNLSCSEVWVKPGIYKPTATTDQTISFVIRPGTAVYGGFAGTESQPSDRTFTAGVSILSGDIDSNDVNSDHNLIDEVYSNIQGSNSYHVVIINGTVTAVTSSTVLDGFTITGGKANSPSSGTQQTGGGLFCDGNGVLTSVHQCNPTLSNLVFSGNYSEMYGGGLFNSGEQGISSPTLSDITFTGNYASNGAGLYNNGVSGVSSPTLTDVTFSSNYALSSGAGMYSNGSLAGLSSPILTRVVFSANSTGGLGAAVLNDAFSGGTSNAQFYDAAFTGNHAGKGGAVTDIVSNGGTNSPIFSRALFEGNQADDSGGAVYLFATDVGSTSSPKFANVTFDGNHSNTSSGYNGGAVSTETSGGAVSRPEFLNTTFHGNYSYMSGAVYNRSSGGSTSQPVITNSILWGNTDTAGYPEIGNLSSTPTIRYSVVQGSHGSGPSWDTTLGTDGGNNLDSDPHLAVLGDYGGFSQTLALGSGSSAIDTGDNVTCAAAPISNVDQRGSSRPFDGNGDGTSACDRGAFEAHLSSWVGSVSVTASRDVVVVGRPHVGSQVMAYDGFTAGNTTMYVPMLFHTAWGAYDSALYVQNVDSANTADISINYYDTNGNLTCTHNDSIPKLSSHGYWIPIECVPYGWVGSATITSNRNIVAIGRPHVGAEVTSYNGFASGSLTMYVPMLFHTAWGSYESALYVQNVDSANTADITIDYYDTSGNLTCSHADSIPRLSSHGYWIASECVPYGWVGSATIRSNHNIVAMGRPHIGSQVTAYDGFAGGTLHAYVPMMYSNADGGTRNTALYIQDLDPDFDASVTLDFYDRNGNFTCQMTDLIPPLSSHGYWVATQTCVPQGWTGGVKITADHNIVALGRPHFGEEVFAYNGFTGGSLSNYVPMLFAKAWGAYNAGYYMMNLDESNVANLNIKYYDVNGNLTYQTTDALDPLAARDIWVPDVLTP